MNWFFVLVFVCLSIFSAFAIDLMLRIRFRDPHQIQIALSVVNIKLVVQPGIHRTAERLVFYTIVVAVRD